jgi:hypothetical protein
MSNDALQSHEEARALRFQLAYPPSPVIDYQVNLAGSDRNVAKRLKIPENGQEVVRLFEESRAIFARLALEHPSVARHRLELARTLYTMSAYYPFLGKRLEALQW